MTGRPMTDEQTERDHEARIAALEAAGGGGGGGELDTDRLAYVLVGLRVNFVNFTSTPGAASGEEIDTFDTSITNDTLVAVYGLNAISSQEMDDLTEITSATDGVLTIAADTQGYDTLAVFAVDPGWTP